MHPLKCGGGEAGPPDMVGSARAPALDNGSRVACPALPGVLLAHADLSARCVRFWTQGGAGPAASVAAEASGRCPSHAAPRFAEADFAGHAALRSSEPERQKEARGQCDVLPSSLDLCLD